MLTGELKNKIDYMDSSTINTKKIQENLFKNQK